MTDPAAALARAFEADEIDPGRFRHRDHVAVAYALLRDKDFTSAAAIYGDGLRALTLRAGVPEKYNTTITVAFLALIAERIATTAHDGFDDFIAKNPDLLSKDVLSTWYAPERLRSDLARRVFLMPEAPR